MREGNSTPGIVSMQKWTLASASPGLPFAPHTLSPNVKNPQSHRLTCLTWSGDANTGQLRRASLERSSKQAFRAENWIRSFSWLLILLIFASMALPSTAAESSFSKGTKALRLKKLLCKALSAKEPCTALADAVKTGGIRVIAVDFDLTMITVHSGGSASNVPDNPIFTSLSPDFDAFASAATSRGIPIAVVTFGDPRAIASRPDRIAGEPLVQRVLEGSAASFKVDAVFPFYPPLYQWPADYKVLGLKEPMPFSKSFHISKVLEHFGVSKEQVLLIDDDPNNCSAFAAEGGVSLRVAGDRGFDCANLEVV